MKRLVVGLAAAAVLLSGCGPVSPAEAARARDLAKGENGAAVTLQLPEKPRTMSPFAPIGSAELTLAQLHFQPMLAGSDGGLIPRAVNSWVPFAEGRRLAIIAPRAVWSDGVPLSARDLISSIEAHLDPRTKSPFANELLAIKGAREFRDGQSSSVSGLTSDQFRNVVIDLAEPNPHFVEHLTQIPVLPDHIYPTRDAMVNADYKNATVGLGPYLIDQWREDGSVTFKPNPKSYPKGGQPRLTGLVARPVARDQVVSEMQAGRLDIASAHDVDPAKVPAGVRLESAPGNTLVTLTPAPGRLNDPRVRRAISHAIDRQSLVENELKGRGRAVESLLFMAEWAQAPDAAPTGHDPAAARRLLAEAGWNPATEVKIAVVAEAGRSALWTKVADQLRAVGINARVETYDPHDQTALAERADYDLLAGQWNAPVRQPSLVAALVKCGGAKETNTGQYCNPRLDAEIASATAALTADDQASRWRAVSRDLALEQPVLPLFVPDVSVAMADSLAPLDPTLEPLNSSVITWVRR